MIIGISSMALASVLGFGRHPSYPFAYKSRLIVSFACAVIRWMLITENKKLDREEKEMSQAKRLRIEEAARLEGLTFEEALERNKGFRYLY